MIYQCVQYSLLHGRCDLSMYTVYIAAEKRRFINVHNIYILLQRRWDLSVCTVTICTTAGETCAQCILLHGEIRDLSMYTVYTALQGDVTYQCTQCILLYRET